MTIFVCLLLLLLVTVTVKARRTEHEKTRANLEAIRARLDKLRGEYTRFASHINQRRAAVTAEVTHLRNQVRVTTTTFASLCMA